MTPRRMFFGCLLNLKKRQLVSIWARCRGDLLIRLHSAVAANVNDLDSVLHQDAPDEQAAMARGRVFLGAQHGHPALADPMLQARQSFLELWCFRHAIVQDVSILVVKFLAVRAPAQLLAKV